MIALRSWARARLANSAAVARKSCIVDVLFVYRTCEREMQAKNNAVNGTALTL